MAHDRDGRAFSRATGRFWRGFEHVDRVVLWLGWAGLAVAAVFVALVFLLLISAALTRPWSNYMFGLAYEAGSVMMWPISFLPLAAVWRLQGHVRFDLFLRMTRRRPHHVMELMGSVIVLCVSILFIWQAWVALMTHYGSSTATLVFRWPVWPVFMTAVIGSVILGLELICSVLRELREVIHPTGVEEDTYGVFSDSQSGV
jgi:TRAP-type C4-dicarboxylate transport system permease small subunit